MLSVFPVSALVGTLLGFLSGLGVGGGSLLILWLTLVVSYPVQEARVMNLLFFLPAAAISCIIRRKQGNLNIKKLLPAIVAGCAAAFLCSRLSGIIQTAYLKKIFGFLLLATGIREILYKPKKR